jgi:sensor histidine kinase YesM
MKSGIEPRAAADRVYAVGSVATDPRRYFNLLLLAVGGNMLIALVLWMTRAAHSFATASIQAQCIGLCIFHAHMVLRRYETGSIAGVLLRMFEVVIGISVGVFLAQLLGVREPGAILVGEWKSAFRFMGLAAIFSCVFIWVFRSRNRFFEAKAEQQATQLRETTERQAALAARLRLLQAQIEPHFLFNTLANLQTLVGRDDAGAHAMLTDLNDYLRATLVHSRLDKTSLGDECRLIASYLRIQSQRMGGRLTWQIDVPEDLARMTFPPMLLQPLVENGIRHGIEPKIGPGLLRVQVRDDGQRIVAAVIDDGVGLVDTERRGVGLVNVRERLAALFGPAATFELIANTPSGLIARLWIPKSVPAS